MVGMERYTGSYQEEDSELAALTWLLLCWPSIWLSSLPFLNPIISSHEAAFSRPRARTPTSLSRVPGRVQDTSRELCVDVDPVRAYAAHGYSDASYEQILR